MSTTVTHPVRRFNIAAGAAAGLIVVGVGLGTTALWNTDSAGHSTPAPAPAVVEIPVVDGLAPSPAFDTNGQHPCFLAPLRGMPEEGGGIPMC